MREIFKIIKQHFILLLGTGLFTYGLFSFDSDRHCDKGSFGGLSLSCNHPATFYYYDYLTLILLVTGVIFIVIGLLKMRKKEGKN